MDSSELKPPGFTAPAVFLHWTSAVIIVLLVVLGLYMSGLPLSPDKLRYYSWHKWGGVTVFLLTFIRLILRVAGHEGYAFDANVVAWQRRAARLTHMALYVLLFAIPVSGWAMSSAKGVPTVYLGLWQLPDAVPRDAALGRQLVQVHVWLNYVMWVFVGLHVAAALKHHFLDRDDVLRRMLPARLRGQERV